MSPYVVWIVAEDPVSVRAASACCFVVRLRGFSLWTSRSDLLMLKTVSVGVC